jgi:type III pantothenate kinase
MRLLIDAGNSRLKWNLSDDEGVSLLQQTRAIPWRDTELTAEMDAQWQGLRDIHSVWLSNVAGEALQQTLQHWLQQHWQLDLNIAGAEATWLGVTNGYRDYTQLGVDRWLTLLACHALLPQQDACIIDCGSAITVDVLTGEGKHLGGMILPGPDLMLQSLLTGIHVPESSGVVGRDQRQDAGQWLGQSTAECIEQGIRHSSLGFLEHIIALMQQTLGNNSRIVLTGGDAPQYLSHITQDVAHYPDLVLQGLLLVSGTQT